MLVNQLLLVMMTIIIMVAGNSAPEQSLQAKQYEQIIAAAKANPTRPTMTIAEQPTIMLHEMMQAQEPMVPPMRVGPGGGPYLGRGFKQNPNVISIGAVLDTPEGIAQFMHVSSWKLATITIILTLMVFI